MKILYLTRKAVRQTDGWISISRNILEWGWYKDKNTFKLFLHMLLKANWKDGEFMGVKIERGSFATSLTTLVVETGLSEREVRTAIKHLESTGEVTGKRHSKFTVFTIKNYNTYQEGDTLMTPERHPSDRQVTGERQRSDTQASTIEQRNKGTKEQRNKGTREQKKEKTTKKETYFPQDEKLNNSFLDFIQHRKAIKSPMTDIAITRAISKLQELSAVNGVMDNDLAIKIIDQSIVNGWKGLFQLQEKNQPKKQGEDWEAWFRWAEEKDKEIAERRKNDSQGNYGDNAGA